MTRRARIVLIAVACLLIVPIAAYAGDRFTDVPDSNVFHDDITWLAEAGVTVGCNPPANDEFCPSDNVTREQMAAFMRRLAENRVVDAGTVEGHTVDDIVALAGGGTGGGDPTAILNRLNSLETRVADLEAENTDLAAENAAMATLLDGVSRASGPGRAPATIRFSGVNVQIVNGQGHTYTTNGLGNLIIGYNAPRQGGADRNGSHYLIVGDAHQWTSYGGIVAGIRNNATGPFASVTGGEANTASGFGASVSGGESNTASSQWSSVSGGHDNTASSPWSSVSGGHDNTASGLRASVSGGHGNTAGGSRASVSGGQDNIADGVWSSILGGDTRLVNWDHGIYPPP